MVSAWCEERCTAAQPRPHRVVCAPGVPKGGSRLSTALSVSLFGASSTASSFGSVSLGRVLLKSNGNMISHDPLCYSDSKSANNALSIHPALQARLPGGGCLRTGRQPRCGGCTLASAGPPESVSPATPNDPEQR
jgi:hypothetical protein